MLLVLFALLGGVGLSFLGQGLRGFEGGDSGTSRGWVGCVSVTTSTISWGGAVIFHLCRDPLLRKPLLFGLFGLGSEESLHNPSREGA